MHHYRPKGWAAHWSTESRSEKIRSGRTIQLTCCKNPYADSIRQAMRWEDIAQRCGLVHATTINSILAKTISRHTPIAKTGLPAKPVKNRRPNTVDIFFAVTIGTCKIKNRARVLIYTGLRPMGGISWRGHKNIGPMPYARM